MQKKETLVKSTELMGSTIYFEYVTRDQIKVSDAGFHYWGAFHTNTHEMRCSYGEFKKRRNAIYVDASTEGVYRLIFIETDYMFIESDYMREFTPERQMVYETQFVYDANFEYAFVVNWSERLPDETPELAGYRLFWAYVRLMDDLLPDQSEATSARFGVAWTDGSDMDQKVLFVFAAVRKTNLPWNLQSAVRREAPAFLKQAILSRIAGSEEFNANNDAKQLDAQVSPSRKPMEIYVENDEFFMSEEQFKLIKLIAQYDPLGFVRAYSSISDYVYETTHIHAQMHAVKSREEMHDLIYDEFGRKDKNRLIGPKERYWKLACDVFDTMTEQGKAQVIKEKEQKESRYKAEKAYVKKHVLAGLRNINDGFDFPGIEYFSEAEFAIVLDRVEALGLGIHGIEPWYQDRFFDVETNGLGKKCTDPSWYRVCFEDFKKLGFALQYSATYHVPDHLLNEENEREE